MAYAYIQSNSKDQSTVCDHTIREYQTVVWNSGQIVCKQQGEYKCKTNEMQCFWDTTGTFLS